MTSHPSPVALPTLVVTGGPRDGHELVLEAPAAEKVLGRGPSCHLRLDSPSVDVVHAQVSWEDRGLVISDVGSDAGTYVNGERVGVDHLLQDGDRISLGPPGSPTTVKLLVRLPAGMESAAEKPAPPSAEDDGAVFILAGDEPEAEPPPLVPPPRTAAPPPSPPSVPAILDDLPMGGLAPPKVKVPERPPHTSDVPSMTADRVREPVRLPPPPPPEPAAAKAKRRSPSLPSLPDLGAVPRIVWVALAAVVLLGGGFYLYSTLQKPPPTITGLSPVKAEPGQPLTVSGTNFESDPAANTVRFGDETGVVTAATPTQLTVTVPPGLAAKGPVDVNVIVESRGDASNPLFLKVARVPRVTSLEPEVALPGSVVAVIGQNLDTKPVTVRVAGQPAEVRAVSPKQIRIVVPSMPMAEGQKVAVSVQAGAETAPPVTLVLGRLPMVFEVVPSSGPVGEKVTIKGRGFDPNPAGDEVTFAGTGALVLSASPVEIQAVVPPPPRLASQLPMPVVVRTRGDASSSTVSYTAFQPSGTFFRPRFVAALAPDTPPHRHVFVSTQLGPVLVLTGKGDSPSLAERAHRVAQRLNPLMDTAAERSVTLELRESPAPSVAVAGGDVILSVTNEDADGYARSWDGGASKASRPTPRQVAVHWTALLQDYLGLFGQRQRPVRTLEVTPRGKILLELYAEAERRGATAGVPASILSPLSPALAKGLQDLALVLPTGAVAAAGGAVAGHWEGTMDEAAGQRPIRMDLHLEGSRLVGSMTTKAGEVSMAVPLQDVVYDKGQLRFAVSSAGSARHFRGTLEGAVLSGNIHQGSASSPPVGRFTLRFVE